MLREVSKKITLVANFGIGQTGLATVGYKLWNGDGTQFQARTTTGVSEIRAGTGSYKVELATSVFTADFDGYVEWDTGGGSPVYIYEDVHIVAELDAAVSSRSTYAGADTAGTTTLLTRIASALTITGGKVDVNDKTGYALTSAYDPAKTAAQAGDAMALTSGERTTLTATMWAALTSGLSTVGSIGKLLVTNVDAAVSSRLATSGYTAPDNAGIAAIEATTDLLGTGVITYGGPVLSADRIELVQGDDYLVADGRELSWTSEDWPSLTSSSVTLGFRRTVKPHTTTTFPGSATTANRVQVELTSDDTDDLADGTWSFALKAVLSNSSEVTLAEGTALVVEFP